MKEVILLNNKSRHLWSLFLSNKNNLGHASRRLHGHDIDAHVDACWLSALETADRVKNDIAPIQPRFILEVGSSTGLNCFALRKSFDGAKVWGIEPESQAVKVAESMNAINDASVIFIEGIGESIPLPDGSVDLILCHTVIEHVSDVPKVISEMKRVLAQDGIIHLEAPNYVWPFEPHLGVWCIPLLGKGFVSLCSKLQGKGRMTYFLKHLQFVHPTYLEDIFNRYSLDYKNRSIEKIEAVFSQTANIKHYKKLATLLRVTRIIGLDRLAFILLQVVGFYPSVLYTIRNRVS